MYSLKRTLVFTFIFSIIISHGSLYAYESGGTITGKLNGESKSWISLQTSDRGETGSSSSFISPVSNMTSFTVQGHNSETKRIMEDVINIDFTVMGEPTSDNPNIVGYSISYFPKGMMPHYNSEEEGGSAKLEIEKIEIDGKWAKLKGKFSGTLVHVDGMPPEADPGNTIKVEGEFEVNALEINL